MARQLYLSLLILFLGTGNVWALHPIQHWSTPNGVRVYFVPAPELPMVDIAVGFDAGSARDPQGHFGLAHLVNVGMREGAANMDGTEIEATLDAIGAELRNDNGRDMSVFELRSLSESKVLQKAAHVLSNILSQPVFPQAAIERERQRSLVALAQEKQSPQQIADRMFYQSLYSGHVYSNPPNGDEDGIKAVTRKDLVEFHQRYFAGSNAVMTIVGDLDRRGAEELVRQVVGGLPKGVPAPVLPEVADLGNAINQRLDFPSNQSHLLIGQPGVSRQDPDYFALYVGNYVLGGSGLISRLAVEIREKRGLAYSIYSYFVPMRERGPFIIGLQTRNDQSGLAEKVARETVSEFVKNGPSADELDAAKKNITGGFPLLLDSNRKIAGNLLTIGFYNLPLDYLDTYSAKIDAVTVEDVRKAFQRRLNPERLVKVVVGGGKG